MRDTEDVSDFLMSLIESNRLLNDDNSEFNTQIGPSIDTRLKLYNHLFNLITHASGESVKPIRELCHELLMAPCPECRRLDIPFLLPSSFLSFVDTVKNRVCLHEKNKLWYLLPEFVFYSLSRIPVTPDEMWFNEKISVSQSRVSNQVFPYPRVIIEGDLTGELIQFAIRFTQEVQAYEMNIPLETLGIIISYIVKFCEARDWKLLRGMRDVGIFFIGRIIADSGWMSKDWRRPLENLLGGRDFYGWINLLIDKFADGECQELSIDVSSLLGLETKEENDDDDSDEGDELVAFFGHLEIANKEETVIAKRERREIVLDKLAEKIFSEHGLGGVTAWSSSVDDHPVLAGWILQNLVDQSWENLQSWSNIRQSILKILATAPQDDLYQLLGEFAEFHCQLLDTSTKDLNSDPFLRSAHLRSIAAIYLNRILPCITLLSIKISKQADCPHFDIVKPFLSQLLATALHAPLLAHACLLQKQTLPVPIDPRTCIKFFQVVSSVASPFRETLCELLRDPDSILSQIANRICELHISRPHPRSFANHVLIIIALNLNDKSLPGNVQNMCREFLYPSPTISVSLSDLPTIPPPCELNVMARTSPPVRPSPASCPTPSASALSHPCGPVKLCVCPDSYLVKLTFLPRALSPPCELPSALRAPPTPPLSPLYVYSCMLQHIYEMYLSPGPFRWASCALSKSCSSQESDFPTINLDLPWMSIPHRLPPNVLAECIENIFTSLTAFHVAFSRGLHANHAPRCSPPLLDIPSVSILTAWGSLPQKSLSGPIGAFEQVEVGGWVRRQPTAFPHDEEYLMTSLSCEEESRIFGGVVTVLREWWCLPEFLEIDLTDCLRKDLGENWMRQEIMELVTRFVRNRRGLRGALMNFPGERLTEELRLKNNIFPGKWADWLGDQVHSHNPVTEWGIEFIDETAKFVGGGRGNGGFIEASGAREFGLLNMKSIQNWLMTLENIDDEDNRREIKLDVSMLDLESALQLAVLGSNPVEGLHFHLKEEKGVNDSCDDGCDSGDLSFDDIIRLSRMEQEDLVENTYRFELNQFNNIESYNNEQDDIITNEQVRLVEMQKKLKSYNLTHDRGVDFFSIWSVPDIKTLKDFSKIPAPACKWLLDEINWDMELLHPDGLRNLLTVYPGVIFDGIQRHQQGKQLTNTFCSNPNLTKIIIDAIIMSDL